MMAYTDKIFQATTFKNDAVIRRLKSRVLTLTEMRLAIQ